MPRDEILLYTARSQHAEIENSHSQRGKSEQALLKLYINQVERL